MKPVLGVSVYPDISPLSEIKQYFQMVSKYGFTRVFSSMFSVEGTKDEVLHYFDELIRAAHEYGLEVSLDVNPECFARMGAAPDDLSVFDSIHCDIVRMDMSFGFEGDLKLLQNPYGIKIEFNASAKTGDEIRELFAAGADPDRLLFCHNFYPQRYTGLRWDKFLRVNKEVREAGARLAAFVSSHAPNTHGVWDAVDGLPTVERLRDLPIDLQMRIMLATGNVTDILIGNAYASEEEVRSMCEVLKDRVLTGDDPDESNDPMIAFVKQMGLRADQPQKVLKVIFEPDALPIEKEDVLHFFPQIDFGDSSEWIWRSRLPRVFYKKETFTPRDPGKEYFERGDVVIVNDSYKHYAGEVQIVRMPMKCDGQRNLVARLAPGEDMLLDLINDGDIVRFLEK